MVISFRIYYVVACFFCLFFTTVDAASLASCNGISNKLEKVACIKKNKYINSINLKNSLNGPINEHKTLFSRQRASLVSNLAHAGGRGSLLNNSKKGFASKRLKYKERGHRMRMSKEEKKQNSKQSSAGVSKVSSVAHSDVAKVSVEKNVVKNNVNSTLEKVSSVESVPNGLLASSDMDDVPADDILYSYY